MNLCRVESIHDILLLPNFQTIPFEIQFQSLAKLEKAEEEQPWVEWFFL